MKRIKLVFIGLALGTVLLMKMQCRRVSLMLPEENYYTVPVIYGTDRKIVKSSDINLVYGPLPDENFNKGGYHAGIVKVSIPKTHERGNIESPNWYHINKNDPSKYVLLVGIDTVKKLAFEKLRQMIHSSDSAEAFVFVHGFNNTFADAAKRTAQLAYDIGFQGCPIMFSWPSNGEAIQYVADYDNVQWAIPHLKSFLKRILSEGKPKKIHLIAHSMGNQLLTNVLREMQAENNGVLFNQIILAAPDIDARIFENDIAPRILKSGKRITMYSSSNDKALIASRKLRTDLVRVGESGTNLMTLKGIETIDASTLTDAGYFNFDLNHSYWAERVTIIEDMTKLFEHNTPPEKRNLLLMKRPPKGDYWSFKR